MDLGIFITHFGLCSPGSDLGSLSLFLLSLGVLFNGVCQGFFNQTEN
jgi:hypothetical protein